MPAELARLAAAVALTWLVGAAAAHGDWPPKHGGLMSEGGEITMELVSTASNLVLYIEDHGDPVNVQQAQGTLEVADADGTSRSLTLVPMGGNRARSDAPLQLRPGMRLVAVFRFEGGIEYKARFRLRNAA